MNKEIAKAKAAALRTYLGSLSIKLNYSRALEALARMEGESSYNALQAKFVEVEVSDKPTVPVLPAPAMPNGPERTGGYDHHGGILPAYRQGRLRVSLWCLDDDATHLTLDVFETDEHGHVIEKSLVTTLCRRLPVSSDDSSRTAFVKNVAEGLGASHSSGMPLSEMRWAVEALAQPDAWYGEIFTELSSQAGLRQADAFLTARAASAAGTEPTEARGAQHAENQSMAWEIGVCRKEKADVTVIVRNATRQEAQNEAIGEVSSRTLDAHIVDYVINEGDLTADDPKVDFSQDGEDSEELRDWEVQVRRVSFAFASVKVEGAASKDIAEMFALDEASEHDFSNTSERHVVKAMKPL